MRPHATADLETDPFKHGRMPKAFAAGFYDGKSLRIFWGGDCVRRMVLAALDFDGIVYLHNGGKFDGHFMLASILAILRERYGMKNLVLTCIGPRMVAIKTPTAEFRDSYSLIPKPLSAFGNKLEIDITKLEANVRETHKVEICKYLGQDCKGLHGALGQFFEQYGQELTLASTTFKVMAKKFGIKPPITDENYDDKFRPAFFAGRVQFFGLGKFGELDGKKRYEILDINSAFPWSMLSPHWFSGTYTVQTAPPKEYKENCFYEVTCDSDGALPMRGLDKSVMFPKVKQTLFFCTGWELFAGKKLGTITHCKIHAVYVPHVLTDFAAYVNYFYELKKNAENVSDREFAKLMLNSFYGRLAINRRDFCDVTVTEYGIIPAAKDVRLKLPKDTPAKLIKASMKKEILMEKDEETLVLKNGGFYRRVYWSHVYDDLERGLTFWQMESRLCRTIPLQFYNVATAASITGKVRAFLAESMAACTDVKYCDTDSIIAADTRALKLGDDLGQWKLEKTCDVIWLGGKKLYVAHSMHDKGVTEKPEKFFKEVSLPGFRRWYLTKKDYAASWKTASKGARMPVEDLIAVCEGQERTCVFDAPNYSPFSKPRFISRTIRRDDMRKKKAA